MKNKKKNKKKTGKMRETKRARVKNAPSAERRERLSLTLSLCVKLDHAQEISVSLLVHESPTTGFVVLAEKVFFFFFSETKRGRRKRRGGKERRTNDAALLYSLKTFESKCDVVRKMMMTTIQDARKAPTREIRV